MRVLLDRPAPDPLRRLVDATLPPWATFTDVARGDPRFGEELARAEVLLHVLDPVSGADIDAAPVLRLIQKFGTGVNTIDLPAAQRRGIAVTNMPGANAPAVAEMTLGLMIAGLRELPSVHAATVAGTAWPGQPSAPTPGAELGSRRVGVIGFGSIGQRVASAAAALGADVVHHSVRDDRPGWVALDDLLTTSDVISLHLPLTDDTANLLDRRRLALVKQGALLVNTSRGGLVDHEALIEALDRGHLRGACLDVWPEEPLPVAHPLLRARGLVATPHVGWFTDETLERCWRRAIDNCRRLRDGEQLMDRVV